MSIKKGDTVIVLTGQNKKKVGKVLFVNKKRTRVLVEDVNKKQRHQRPTQKNQKGGIISVEAPIHISNVALMVNVDGKDRPTRVTRKLVEEGGRKSKLRVSRITGEEV